MRRQLVFKRRAGGLQRRAAARGGCQGISVHRKSYSEGSTKSAAADEMVEDHVRDRLVDVGAVFPQYSLQPRMWRLRPRDRTTLTSEGSGATKHRCHREWGGRACCCWSIRPRLPARADRSVPRASWIAVQQAREGDQVRGLECANAALCNHPRANEVYHNVSVWVLLQV